MAAVNIGTTTLAQLRVGASQVQKIYLGATLVYTASA